MQSNKQQNFNDLPDVALIQIRALLQYKVVPFSATTIWRLAKSGKFPRPIKVSSGVTAWKIGDIRKYLNDQVSGQSNQWGGV
jgi:prophage regulatory protein